MTISISLFILISIIAQIQISLQFLVGCAKKKQSKEATEAVEADDPLAGSDVRSVTPGTVTPKTVSPGTVKPATVSPGTIPIKGDEKDPLREKSKKKEKKEKKDEKEKKEKKKEEKTEKPAEIEEITGHPNKEDDRKQYLTAEPNGELLFQQQSISQVRVVLTNKHDKKVIFKIKFSNNEAYKVNPVYGTIEPGQTCDLAVTHNKSTCKKAKMVVVNTECPEEVKEPAEVFKTAKITGASVTIKLVAK